MNLRVSSMALFAMLATAAWAQIKLEVNLKDGDSISGEKRVVVLATSKNDITSVEFYLNGDLRETDDGTPSEYTIDTVAEEEGEVTLKVAAFTGQGDKSEKTIKLKVDNGIGRGADFFVKEGDKALESRNTHDAIMNGKLALKADAASKGAKMLLARAYMIAGTYDSAQKYVEDVLELSKDNAEGLELASAIYMRRAFSAINRGGDRSETLGVIKDALKKGAEARSRATQLRLGSVGPVTDANRLAYADAAMRAGRFSLVIDALLPAYRKDMTNSEVANRLVYAYLRTAKFDLAASTILTHAKQISPDGLGNILLAIVQEMGGSQNLSLEAEKNALIADSQSISVRTGQAYLALLRGRNAEFARLGQSLGKDAGENNIINYYLSTLYFSVREFDASNKSFEKALLAEPSNYDMLIQRANQAIAFSFQSSLAAADVTYQRDLAKAYFEAALAAKPDSFEALTGLSVLEATVGTLDKALDYARAAVAAGPTYAAGHYVLAMVSSAQAKRFASAEASLRAQADRARSSGTLEESKKLTDQANSAKLTASKLTLDASAAIKAAGKYDKVNLEGRAIPEPFGAWTYFARYGRLPLLPFGL